LILFYNPWFTAPPVVLGKNKVAAQLGNLTSFVIKIYSLDPVSVSLNRSVHAIANNVALGNTMVTFTQIITPAEILLPVFDKEIKADGFQSNISFVINSQEQFGEYQVIVSNNIGVTQRTMEFVPGGMLVVRHRHIF